MRRSSRLMLGYLLLTVAVLIAVPLHVRLTGATESIAEKLGENSRSADKPGPQWKPVLKRGPDWSGRTIDTSVARSDCVDSGISVLSCADTYRIVGTSMAPYNWPNTVDFKSSDCAGEKSISVKFKIPRHGKDGEISLEHSRVRLSYRWGKYARPQKGEYSLSAYGHAGATLDGKEFDYKWKFTRGWGRMPGLRTEEKEFTELKLVISSDRYTVNSYVNSRLIGTQVFQDQQSGSRIAVGLSVPGPGHYTDIYITDVRSVCR